MKTLGIIAEYNPFHNGHKYHIETAKAKSGADCVVAIISGDFTQRGQMAVSNKWDRAKWALENGVDLVIELPAIYATSNAGAFAKGGVSILEAMGVDYISFGAESDEKTLTDIACCIKENHQEIHSLIKTFTKEGMSFPKAREKALKTLNQDLNIEAIGSPNNILAIEYLLNMVNSKPVIVKRSGTGYNQEAIKGLPSATAIRSLAEKGQNYANYVPKEVNNIIAPNMEKMWEMAQFQAISRDEDFIDSINSSDQGFGNLIKQNLRYSKGYDDLVHMMTSKRYTASRVTRFICQLILGITKEIGSLDARYVHVLGFNQTGSALLKSLKKTNDSLPIITNINKALDLDETIFSSLEVDIKANDIYNLLHGLDLYKNSDYVKMPVIIQK